MLLNELPDHLPHGWTRLTGLPLLDTNRELGAHIQLSLQTTLPYHTLQVA